MFEQVLSALTNSGSIDRIAIVGPNPHQCSADLLLLDDPGKGLNAALSRASAELRMRGAEELLVIHADLPFVSSEEIDDFVQAGREQSLGLASDRHGRGTNALYLKGATDFPFLFGPDSFRCHQAAAEARSIRPSLTAGPGLLVDIDTEEDLKLLGNEFPLLNNIELYQQRTLSHA